MSDIEPTEKNKKQNGGGGIRKIGGKIASKLLSKPFSAVFVCILLAAVYLFLHGGYRPEITASSVSLLVRETPVQLVTNTITTMVACTIDDIPEYAADKIRNVILGKSEGVFITKVKYIYGLDLLNDMSEDDVTVEDEAIIITLPAPKLLYRDIDLNYSLYTKTSLWRVISDKFAGVDVEKEMRRVFQAKAVEFIKDNGLEPKKEEIIRNIEPFFNKIFAGRTNKKIIFK
jgi:hypothetical protein